MQKNLLLNPTETKLKSQKTSSGDSKTKATQTNQVAGIAKASSSKNSNSNLVSNTPGQPEKQELPVNESSPNTLTNSAQSDSLDKPYIKRCRQAIRSFCLECQGRLSHAVEACEDHDCKLYHFRKLIAESQDSSQRIDEKPVRAVRQHCLICCGGERGEVRNCAAGKTCTLWPFRFGVNPAIYRKVKEKWRGPKHYSLPGF